MRYIPLLEYDPKQHSKDPDFVALAKLLKKASHLLAEMDKIQNDEDQIKALIDKNDSVWGGFKDWLLKFSYGKCWFSEARDCVSHWEVEHFRPKKSVRDINDAVHMGYWWLAFDWSNFRICGNMTNRKKSTYFPLRPGSQRAGRKDDWRTEEQYLLDPANSYDTTLISFNRFGKVIPRPGLIDPWELERVNYSIDRYGLNSYAPLVEKRKIVWANCESEINIYLKELNLYHCTSSQVARKGAQDASQRIRALLSANQEFSTVSRACVLNRCRRSKSDAVALEGLLQSV